MNVSIFNDNVFEQTDHPFEKVYHRKPSTAGRLKCQDESLHWMVVQVKFCFELLLIKTRGVENKCVDSFAAKQFIIHCQSFSANGNSNLAFLTLVNIYRFKKNHRTQNDTSRCFILLQHI